MDDSEAEDLRYFPSVVEVVDTRLEGGGGHTAYYILRCRTPAMHSWGVAKRFSQFCSNTIVYWVGMYLLARRISQSFDIGLFPRPFGRFRQLTFEK